MANVDSSDTPTPNATNPSSTPSVEETTAQAKTRRKTDPAWGYCTEVIEGGKKKIKCMYCNMIFKGGGIHRFKEHLAKVPGNVASCLRVEPEVQYAMDQHIKEWNARKRKAQEDYEEDHPYDVGPEDEAEDDYAPFYY